MSTDAIDQAVRQAQASSLQVFRDALVEVFHDAPMKYGTAITVQDVLDLLDSALATVNLP